MVAVSVFCSATLAMDSSRFPSYLAPKTLAGAEGFEPPSSVLETDSLTVELTPLSHCRFGDFRLQIEKSEVSNLKSAITSLPCAACACGRRGRTFSAPDAPSWS